MDNINDSTCIICNFSVHNIIFSYDVPDQYEIAVGVSEKGYFRHWVQCKNCGFYYSIYSRDKEIIHNIYADAYRNEKSPWRQESVEETFSKIINLPENKSETKIRVKWIKKNIKQLWESEILKNRNEIHQMLDIGGGTGIFAYEFMDKDWESNVIDPNADGQFIEKKLKIPFIQESYAPNRFKHNFDLITLIYVLEHLRDPSSIVKDLHSDMTDNSLIYIEVPDAISFKLKSKEDDIFNSCHLWMFDPNNITRFLNNYGFQVFSLHRMKTIRDHYALMVLAGKII